MHSPESVFEDLEGDQLSRQSEIKLIERLLQDAKNEEEQAMLKRSLILLIYAHLEGFCKFAIFAYASALNALKLPCADAAYPIVAISLSKVFSALRDPNSKHEAFRRKFSEDAQLHLAARERRFVESYEGLVKQTVNIPDNAIDTKSNLSADVLKKILFQIGLHYPAVDAHEGSLNRLLGIRNAIAHGDRLKIPTEKELREYTETAFEIMKFIQGEVFDALSRRLYLK